MFVTFVIQHEMCIPHSVVCGLSGSTMLFHSTLWMTRFSEKCIQHTIYVLILLHKFRRYISHSKELSKMWSIMYIVLLAKYPLLLSGILKTSSFSVDLRETLIKFHGNPSRVSLVVPCGRGHGQVHWNDEANGRFSQSCKRAYAVYRIRHSTFLLTFRPFPQS